MPLVAGVTTPPTKAELIAYARQILDDLGISASQHKIVRLVLKFQDRLPHGDRQLFCAISTTTPYTCLRSKGPGCFWLIPNTTAHCPIRTRLVKKPPGTSIAKGKLAPRKPDPSNRIQDKYTEGTIS